MGDSPTTRPSLLLQIRNPHNTAAWTQFVEIYMPLVHRYAVRRGLQDADAADVAQDVFKAIAARASHFQYDPTRGSFRSWLYTVARSKLHNHLARRRKQERATGESRVRQILESQPDSDHEDETQWNIDYQRQMFDWGAQQVRPSVQEATWSAFWQTAVEQKPAGEVAELLGMSIGAIYVAKSRVLAQIRQRIQSVISGEDADHPLLSSD